MRRGYRAPRTGRYGAGEVSLDLDLDPGGPAEHVVDAPEPAGGPELPRGLPYGIWRRRVSRGLLDAVELARRDDEESWDLRNESLADRLDALEGATVRLLATTRALAATYRRGMRFTVLGRVKDKLIARSVEKIVDGERVVVLLGDDEVKKLPSGGRCIAKNPAISGT